MGFSNASHEWGGRFKSQKGEATAGSGKSSDRPGASRFVPGDCPNVQNKVGGAKGMAVRRRVCGPAYVVAFCGACSDAAPPPKRSLPIPGALD